MPGNRYSEHGGTILEYMLSMLILMPLVLVIIGMFQMVTTRLLTDYAAYVGGRAYSLGYDDGIVRRATELAASGAAGPDISFQPLPKMPEFHDVNARGRDYLRWGNSGRAEYNVRFLYWRGGEDLQKRTWKTRLRMSFAELENRVASSVWFENYPMLLGRFGRFFFGNRVEESSVPRFIPSGYYDTVPATTRLRNHSMEFLDRGGGFADEEE